MIVSGKKERRYVHAEDQMQAILMETGLTGASLRRAEPPRPAGAITGDRLKSLLDLVASIEQGLRAFGRRNRSLREFLAMAYKPKSSDSAKPDPRDGLLPLFLVEHEGKEERLYSEKDRHDYFAAHDLHMDVEAELESGLESATPPLPAAAAEGLRLRRPLPPTVVAFARLNCTRSRCSTSTWSGFVTSSTCVPTSCCPAR